jgi:cytidyltransferase-like protein
MFICITITSALLKPINKRSLIMSTSSLSTTSSSLSTSSSLPIESMKYKNALLELIQPDGKMKKTQLIHNDDIISKVVKEVSDSLYVYVLADPNTPKGTVSSYISEIYSRLWDEMLQYDSKLKLNCYVIGDIHEAGFISRQQTYAIPSLEAVYTSDISTATEYRNARVNSGGLSDLVIEDVKSVSGSNNIFGEKIYYCDAIGEKYPKYKRVAVGGTFDRIHNGHRNLLTLAASSCTDGLIVGIMGDNMLKNKKNSWQINDFNTRIQGVTSFLSFIKPILKVEISELNDPYGPAITDKMIEAIVVSSETVEGAKVINRIREEKGMNPLAILVTRRENAGVLSSTFIREKLGAFGRKRKAIKTFFKSLFQ